MLKYCSAADSRLQRLWKATISPLTRDDNPKEIRQLIQLIQNRYINLLVSTDILLQSST
jgi:hypothetical protein